MQPTPHIIPLQEAIENAHKERAATFAALYRNWFGLRSLLRATDTLRSA